MASKEEIKSKQVDSSAAEEAEMVDGLADATRTVQDAAEKLIQFSRETAVDAEDALAAGVKGTTKLIKKYPLESALVCFGVGVIAGLLLKNRD